MAGNHSSGTGGVLGSSELNRDTAGLQGTYGWAVQSGAVTFSTGLTFNVAAIATADYKVAGVNGASYAGGTVVLTTQDPTNPRVDIIVITVAGAVTAVAGTPAALTTTGGPGPATPTAAQLEIARIYVPASGGLLSASSITDRRVALPDGAVTLTVTGDIIYASAAHTPARLAIGSTNQALGVTGGIPAWQASPTSVLTTTGDVLYASGANTLARLGIGSSAQLLTVSGGLPAWVSPASAGATNYQAFTGSGTWTKPAGTTASSQTIISTWAAGGGGGGGRSSASSSGSGGGGGSFNQRTIPTSALGSTETVTIGAGGAGGAPSGAAGGNGGNTTFGSWALAGGGGGGGGAFSSPSYTSGAGGGSMTAAARNTAGLPDGIAGTGFANDGTTVRFGGANGGGYMDSGSGGGVGGASTYGGSGGGGGGASANGKAGGAFSGTGNGGAGGTSGSTPGVAGATGVETGHGGAGGGGGFGGSGIGGVGGAGGAAGGGGGGGGDGTSTGGTAGAGGAGYMQVITIL